MVFISGATDFSLSPSRSSISPFVANPATAKFMTQFLNLADLTTDTMNADYIQRRASFSFLTGWLTELLTGQSS